MPEKEFFELLLDSFKDQVVFVDAGHEIRYMNKKAVEEHNEGEKLIGKSIFDCHSDESSEKIRKAYSALCNGAEEVLISEKKGKRIFIRAVREKNGRLAGYFERYEKQ